MTAALDGVPIDTFAVRLAVVRAVMGWNYDQAARATGIGAETWRTWEKGTRRCTDIVGAASKISDGTDGVVSRDWLVLGGPLAQEPAPTRDLTAARTHVRSGVSTARRDLTKPVNERYRVRKVRLIRHSVTDDWRIRDLHGSHELPILHLRHGRNQSRCHRVAA